MIILPVPAFVDEPLWTTCDSVVDVTISGALKSLWPSFNILEVIAAFHLVSAHLRNMIKLAKFTALKIQNIDNIHT